jgi:UDP-N-acetylglucosamine acyltransferase
VAKIDPSARVSPDARLGRDVVVGPFCLIRPGAAIGDGCILDSYVVVEPDTSLGQSNRVFHGAVLGAPPQHIAAGDEVGTLEIGSANVIREHVTIHRALKLDGVTRVGNRNMIMAGAHIAHDCRVGNHVIMANNVLLAGHVSVDDRAFLSGSAVVHQFCRVGYLAMLGALARIGKDVAPYVTIDGGTNRVVGLNLVGIRRAGMTPDELRQLKAAYRLVFRSVLPWEERIARLRQEFSTGPAGQFQEFFQDSVRSYCQERLPRDADEEFPRHAQLAAEGESRDLRPLRKAA